MDAVKENIPLNLGSLSISDLRLLKEGAKMFQQGKVLDAQRIFAFCASNFEAYDSIFWAALAKENLGEAFLTLSHKQSESKLGAILDCGGKEAYLKAANNYRCEAEFYENNRCLLLAERALVDKAWCESWAMGKQSHTHRYSRKVV